MSDVLRVLLATDIHLGYGERHPVKANDSFTTFDEILSVAVEQKVDFVLLGGDLFHENKPSRDAEVRAIRSLRNTVLGDRPVSFEMISDPKVDFAHIQDGRRHANFMDDNLNIGLPVFSVHGNHDDPVGIGGHSCMDLMHASGMLNYFGKITSLESIEVNPLLMVKGETRLALYGMSALKEDRLHRLFRSNKVTMNRPNDHIDDWFNLLVVHQNRAKHGPTNYLPEHFIDDFFDLVFWGHEHECRLEPEQAVFGEKAFFVTQPGSSVATSLSEGEAKQKCIGVLEVHKNNFKINKIELKTVRPMIFKNVSLDDHGLEELKRGTEKEVQAKVMNHLREYVEELLATELDELLTGHVDQPTMPQVRVRVEYTDGKQVLQPGRFGNFFEGKVANHNEILLFKKKVQLKKREEDDGIETAKHVMDTMEGVQGSSMKDLLSQYFTDAEAVHQMQLLSTKGINGAVESFIQKDYKDAINVIVERQLEKAVNALCSNADLEDETDEAIDEALETYQLQRKRENADDEAEARKILAKKSQEMRTTTITPSNDDIELVSDEEDVENQRSNGAKKKRGAKVSPPVKAAARGARGGRGSRGGRGAKAANESIKNAFAKQSQRTTRKKAPVVFEDSDSE